jgi:thiol-disulfide isomerase/thioredoxin
MNIKRVCINTVVFTSALVFVLQLFPTVSSGTLEKSIKAPAFTQTDTNDWLNSPPLSYEVLKGKVVLLDFWTFECWNCYRSFPWMNALQGRLEDQGLQIIGVHTPEFAHEKVKENIIAKIKEFNLHHPVMIDNDFTYWNAMGNRFWPAFYIIDKNSNVRAVYYGETHEGDDQAKEIEAVIKTLLKET